MTITDSHVAFLRAYLYGEEDDATSAWGQITAPDGLGLLVRASLAIAAGRQFAPAWTRADVVRYVARTRAALSERPDLIDPRTAEYELRRALGDATIAPAAQPGPAATAQLILLSALAVSLDLDDAGLDQLLQEARDTAEGIRYVGPPVD